MTAVPWFRYGLKEAIRWRRRAGRFAQPYAIDCVGRCLRQRRQRDKERFDDRSTHVET